MPRTWPGSRGISIHRVGRAIIAADVSACGRRVAGAIPAAVVSAFRRAIPTMLHFPVGARRDHIAVEVAWPSAGRHCRPPMIHRSPLRAIRSGCMLMLYLLSPGFKVMIVLRNPLTFAFAHLNSVRPTVEADSIDIIHYHRAIVRVMNHRHVDVGNRAIVDKFSSAPFAAIKAHARVAVAII